MTARRRIYLDNAATSYPKPEAVYVAVERYQRELGTAVGRGATRAGSEVQRMVDRCRSRVARLFGARRPEQVIFTFNGTDSLNLALHGLLRRHDHVVTTTWEHNSVLRPLKSLASTHAVRTDIIATDNRGQVDLDQFQKRLTDSTRLVVVTHASNVTGVIQPVREMSRLARERGAVVLLDAAQTAGHIPVTLDDLGVDLIACPGHKGLMGPLGTGLLVMRSGLESELEPIRQGGTGTVSESDDQPATLPDRYESGNHNAPGLAGLEAALAWKEGRETPHGSGQATGTDEANPVEEGTRPFAELLSGLLQLPRVTVHYGHADIPRVEVVSISVERMEPQVVCSLLDDHFGIETRAGLHCAPLAHAALGTNVQGGTVRFSTGPLTTLDNVDRTLEALGQIVATL